MNGETIRTVRGNIPALEGRVYLNYGAAGTMPRTALEAIRESFERQQADGPFSAEALVRAESEMAQTKRALASLLATGADSILLTESVSAGASAVLWGLDWSAGEEVIVSDCENPSVLAAVMSAARRFSLKVRELPVRGVGEEAMLAGLESLLSVRSRLVVISHVSWIDGQVLPVKAMSEVVHACRPEAAILVDGAQAVGCMDVAPDRLDCDFYAFTGSKWVCGPEGCAGLWNGRGFEWCDVLRTLEAGTRPTALLAGLREALRFHDRVASPPERWERMAGLSNLARRELGELAVPGGAPGIVSFRLPAGFPASRARTLVHYLEARDVLIREIPARHLWRICLHYFSTEIEVLEFAALLSRYLDQSSSSASREVCAAS